MQKIIIIGLSFVLFFGFSYGIVVGHYEIFPFELFSDFNKIIKNNNISSESRPQIYQEISKVDELIQIYSNEDIKTKKTLLNNYLWPNGDLPLNKMPIHSSVDLKDKLFSDIESLQQINSFTVEMDFGMTSTSYLFLPKTTNDQLIIYHQGHGGSSLLGPDSHSFEHDKKIIKNFLDKNYSILIFSMPGNGINNEPVIETIEFGTVILNSHNHFRLIENEFMHPIKFFVEPIMITLNQIEKNYDFESFHMVGLSGGGWTTIVVSALDDRIKTSYSVAGSFPIWMRSDPSDLGDYEQTVPEFYKIANYEELYILGAFGEERKLILFYNEFDPCCFPGSLYKQFPFKTIIQERLKILEGGEFDIIIDEGQPKHLISDFTLNQIFSSLESKS